MKRLFIVLSLLMPSILFATPQTKLPNPLTVAVSLLYQSSPKSGLPATNEVQSFFNLSPSQHDQKWIEVSHTRTSHEAGDFIVLSKLNHATAHEATLHFLIIDLAEKKSIILEPTLTLPYGQKKEIALQHKQWTIRLSALITE